MPTHLDYGLPIPVHTFNEKACKDFAESKDCFCPGHFASEGHRVDVKGLSYLPLYNKVIATCFKCSEVIMIDGHIGLKPAPAPSKTFSDFVKLIDFGLYPNGKPMGPP